MNIISIIMIVVVLLTPLPQKKAPTCYRKSSGTCVCIDKKNIPRRVPGIVCTLQGK